MRILLSVALLAPLVAQAAYDPNITARERAFAASVQQAIKRDDKNWLSENTRYPIRVCIGAELTQIRDKAAFLRQYGLIVDDQVRAAVEAQKPDGLVKNFQGVLIGGNSIVIFDDEAAALPNNPRNENRGLILGAIPEPDTHPKIVAINNGSVDPTSRRIKCK